MQLCGGNVEHLCLSPFLLTSRIFSGVIIITRPRSFSPIFLRSYPARASPSTRSSGPSTRTQVRTCVRTWRNVPRAPRNPWAPRAGFGRHSGFGSGFGLARRGSFHHHPRIRWGDLSYVRTSDPNPNPCPPASRLLLDESRFLLDESRCLLDASRLLLNASRLLLRRWNPFTLRAKPFTLRRKPFTLRRQPLTLRRKPFTLRQKPVTLRRKPFTLRRKPFTLRRKPFTLSSLHFLFTNALRRRRLRGLRSESPVRFPRLVFGAKKNRARGRPNGAGPGPDVTRRRRGFRLKLKRKLSSTPLSSSRAAWTASAFVRSMMKFDLLMFSAPVTLYLCTPGAREPNFT